MCNINKEKDAMIWEEVGADIKRMRRMNRKRTIYLHFNF